ncbi:MAG: GtrA family protein [Chloroflexi bacterium]|nr:GtrA family protein [Chloroflexota bacterium]
MNPLPPALKRLFKFGTVGATGVFVNEGMLYLLHGRFLLPLIISSIVAVECSIITNFLLNDRWTFGHHQPAFTRFWRFNLVSLFSLFVNVTVLALLEHFTPLHYLLANPIAITTAFGVNYSLNTYWTYGQEAASAITLQENSSAQDDFKVDPSL